MQKIQRLNIIGIFLGALLSSSVVQAASYDCQKAALTTEKTICNVRRLNDQDVKMATTFNILTHLLPMGGRDSMKDEQRIWLKQRNACAAKVSCIANRYQGRQTQLDNLLSTQVYQQGPF